jgi:aryl-alcohol dehydrogenase-like predicted oxidoreductase
MRFRTFGRLGWQVGEVGYGMWGMGGWSGSDDKESMASLELAVSKGVNFFDTAQAYGDGHSEQLLALLAATAASASCRDQGSAQEPPVAQPSGVPLADVFPRAYVREYVDISRANLGVDTIDLLQLHVWEDDWLASGELRRRSPSSSARARSGPSASASTAGSRGTASRPSEPGLVDSVQVIYNIFDQAPEDELFPACRENGVAVIARVPFDEGSLIGNLTSSPRGRRATGAATYFVPENLEPSRRPRRRPQAARAGGHDDGRDGPPLHPLEPGREHGHPGHAQAVPRRGQHGRERRRAAAARAHGRAAAPPLGSRTTELEPVGFADGGRALPATPLRPSRRRRTAGRMPPWR